MPLGSTATHDTTGIPKSLWARWKSLPQTLYEISLNRMKRRDKRKLMGEEIPHPLKRRAVAFLESAKFNYSKGHYDLVLFHVEQFMQLYLKYLLYKKIGDYPKTRSLIRLVNYLIKVYMNCKLSEFYKENLEMLYLLEEAYISSRYVPREYNKEIAGKVLNFAKKALEVLECLEKQ